MRFLAPCVTGKQGTNQAPLDNKPAIHLSEVLALFRRVLSPPSIRSIQPVLSIASLSLAALYTLVCSRGSVEKLFTNRTWRILISTQRCFAPFNLYSTNGRIVEWPSMCQWERTSVFGIHKHGKSHCFHSGPGLDWQEARPTNSRASRSYQWVTHGWLPCWRP